MSLIGTLDFETDPFAEYRIIEPFLCCVYLDGYSFSLWREPGVPLKKWLKVLEARLNALPKCTLYAHNGSGFDFAWLLSMASTPQQPVVIGGKVGSFKIGNVTLKDSALLIKAKLADYNKTAIDYKKFEPEVREQWRDEIISYCESDCVNLHNLIVEAQKFLGDHLTLASASYQKIKESGVDVKRTHTSYDRELRPWFFGGIVKFSALGVFGGPLEWVDVNSAYPAAMLQRHPHGKTLRVYRGEPAQLRETDFYTIAAPARGVWPYRANGELDQNGDPLAVFPDDKKLRTFKVTGHELLAALELGVYSRNELVFGVTLRHEQFVDFAEFINPLFRKKAALKNKKGREVEYLTSKLLMNSGFGKFGQNPREFHEWALVEKMADLPIKWKKLGMPVERIGDENPLFGKLKMYRASIFNEQIGEFYDGGKRPRFYDVAIAASITGFQRAVMMRAIHKSEGFVYCDTDSIIAKKAKVKIGTKIGEWEKIGDLQEIAVAGKKLYAAKMADGKIKTASKGVDIDADSIYRVARGGIEKTVKLAPSLTLRKGWETCERSISRPDVTKPKKPKTSKKPKTAKIKKKFTTP
jgi:hypothetical protein